MEQKGSEVTQGSTSKRKSVFGVLLKNGDTDANPHNIYSVTKFALQSYSHDLSVRTKEERHDAFLLGKINPEDAFIIYALAALKHAPKSVVYEFLLTEQRMHPKYRIPYSGLANAEVKIGDRLAEMFEAGYLIRDVYGTNGDIEMLQNGSTLKDATGYLGTVIHLYTPTEYALTFANNVLGLKRNEKAIIRDDYYAGASKQLTMRRACAAYVAMKAGANSPKIEYLNGIIRPPRVSGVSAYQVTAETKSQGSNMNGGEITFYTAFEPFYILNDPGLRDPERKEDDIKELIDNMTAYLMYRNGNSSEDTGKISQWVWVCQSGREMWNLAKRIYEKTDELYLKDNIDRIFFTTEALVHVFDGDLSKALFMVKGALVPIGKDGKIIRATALEEQTEPARYEYRAVGFEQIGRIHGL